MLHLLLTWDGVGYVIFMQDNILNIRMTTLYSWLTAADFNIDIKGLFGVQAGIPRFLTHLVCVNFSIFYVLNSNSLLSCESPKFNNHMNWI